MKASIFVAVFLIAGSALLELTSGDQVSKRWLFGKRRRRRRCQPRDCRVTHWCSWSHCSHTCGGHGTQMRTRHVAARAQCGGWCDYTLRETRLCNMLCFNGGVWRSNACQCKYGYIGECCETKPKGRLALTLPNNI